MIIFTSDFHLTDGTFDYKDPVDPKNNISHDVSHEAFKLFWDNIYRIVSANEKDSVKEITLVLLGDILELRSTSKWVDPDCNPSGTRPWNENNPDQIDVCKKIIDGIWENNKESLKYLCPNEFHQIDRKNGLRNLIDSEVKINVRYIVGNHDRLLAVHDSLKEYVKDKFGWEFSRAIDEDGEGHKFKDDDIGILALHGHDGEKKDFVDFYKNYEEPPLGALLSDLTGRLMYHVREENRKELITFCMDIDNVRPSSDRFAWILSNLPRDMESRKILRTILKTSLVELKNESDVIFEFLYSRVEDKINSIPFWGDILIFLFVCPFRGKKSCMKKKIMKLLQKTIEKLNKTEEEYPLVKILNDIQNHKLLKLLAKMSKKKKSKDKAGGPDSRYYENAYLAMHAEGTNTPYKYIVYGHSHRYQLFPLVTLKGDGIIKNTFYFNSGTWKKTVERNLFPGTNGDFQKWNRMTYVTFFKESENRDHVFDIWHGNLQTEKDLWTEPE